MTRAFRRWWGKIRHKETTTMTNDLLKILGWNEEGYAPLVYGSIPQPAPGLGGLRQTPEESRY
jgi:hypothetical protein